MRISDWSSDVCSSDLDAFRPVEAQWALWNHTPDPNYVADPRKGGPHTRGAAVDLTLLRDGAPLDMGTAFDCLHQIGSASCRERVCQYVSISVVAGSLKKKIKNILSSKEHQNTV